ncbi:MAG TPA: hypothetical protein VG165_02790 [Solirubrobacteraceae bacterium]|nr:hypothetical protein [Solirubrobacteraceae bacterium]
MNAFLKTRTRAAAATLAAGALLVGGASAAIAPAAAAPAGLFGSGTTGGQGVQGLGGAGGLSGLSGLFGGTGASALPGPGLFKAVFALFGAVETQVPTIAGPIIAQAQTAGTITPAEATQLTTLLSAHTLTSMTSGAGAGKVPTGSGTPFTKPSAGEIAVIHKVIAAVLGALPTITAPVLVAEVVNGDLTQAESDSITKLIAGLSAMASNASVVSSTTGIVGGSAGAGGNLLSKLASEFAGKLKKPASSAKTHKKKHKHHAKVTTSTRTHHAG